MAVTSNHRDAFYLTPNDRRYYIATSECQTGTFDVAYWNSFWHWYKHENGINGVVALLLDRDLSKFDPKAPPPNTPGFWHMVNADRGEDHGEINDAIDAVGLARTPPVTRPQALTISELIGAAPGIAWLAELKMRRRAGKCLNECGYIAVTNPVAYEGLWVVNGKRQRIYALTDLAPDDRVKAARELAD
jgi:hypothetical protein